jgi:RNA polymerase primary sigma factor
MACLDLYLSETRHHALLTAQEETSLAAAIERGDRNARARMIEANLRLVVKIARQFHGRGLGLDDLIGEGNLGLIRAAQDFNPRFGTRFSTYAAYWIKQAIRAALTNTTATIRLPAHMVGLLGRWRRTERDLRREHGREPTFTEIADSLGLTHVQRELVHHALSTRMLVREGTRESPGESRCICGGSSDPTRSHEAEWEAEEERQAVRRRLERLDARERLVVALRFGLEGDRPLTLQEVGRRLGVTREWVRKIEQRAVRKLDDRAESAGDPPRLPRAGAPASRNCAKAGQPLAHTA